MSFFMGIDVGTAGVRTAVIDANGMEVAAASVPMEVPVRVEDRPCQDPKIWWKAVRQCLGKQAETLRTAGCSMHEIKALAVDGTSGTTLLADDGLNPVTPGYMYNSSSFAKTTW